MTNLPEPTTRGERERLNGAHSNVSHTTNDGILPSCVYCGENWPCSTKRLIADRDRAEQREGVSLLAAQNAIARADRAERLCDRLREALEAGATLVEIELPGPYEMGSCERHAAFVGWARRVRTILNEKGEG